MLDGFQPDIHIQFRPVEVAGARLLHMQHPADGRILEPREILAGHRGQVLNVEFF